MNRLDFAESFPEPHLLVQANGHVVSANRAFHEWVKSTAPNSAGSDLLALFADTPKVLSFLRRCARSRRLLPARLRLQSRYKENELSCEGARFGSASDHTVLLRLRAFRAQPVDGARSARRRPNSLSNRRASAYGQEWHTAIESVANLASQLDASALDPQQRQYVQEIAHVLRPLLPPRREPSFTGQTRTRASAPRAANSSLRVMLVEDNAVSRMVASRMLSRLGLTPDICKDGCEAVERATAQTYDLILMDVQMPKMDGLEATHRIRALQRDHNLTRIVAITANTMEETRQACQVAGMDDFLGKPFTLEQLAETLAKLFGPALL